ncbi:MAG: pilus assembly protein TadG-related protein, partial [Agromyces sp.]
MRRLMRLQHERGAVAVLVALLMIPLLGFGAFALDIGQMFAERRQLQNAADSGALAIAQYCSVADPALCDAASMKSKFADPLANQNSNDGATKVDSVTMSSNQVVVKVSTKTTDSNPSFTYSLRNFLAPLFGVDGTRVGAQATAVWGPPAAGTLFPIAMSLCDFTKAVGTPDANGVITGDNKTVIYTADAKTCNKPGYTAALPGGY